jgi:hydroxymethylpyrimidine/phosphomethylpyrimidine kinase
MSPPVALTIAASDSCGGAGIQADLRTLTVHGVLGACAVTAVTVQDTRGVRAVHAVPTDLVVAQIDTVLADLPVTAAKTGMLPDVEVLAGVAERAVALPHLVVDPVLVSSSGHRLCRGRAVSAYRELLLPRATVITPNLDEAGALLGRELRSLDEAVHAAHDLGDLGVPWVVVSGGHLGVNGAQLRRTARGSTVTGVTAVAGTNPPGRPPSTDPPGEPVSQGVLVVDVLWHDGTVELLVGPRVRTRNDHGTGCTFSAALTAALARGTTPRAAVRAASVHVRRALAGAVDWLVGSGAGPLSWETR